MATRRHRLPRVIPRILPAKPPRRLLPVRRPHPPPEKETPPSGNSAAESLRMAGDSYNVTNPNTAGVPAPTTDGRNRINRSATDGRILSPSARFAQPDSYRWQNKMRPPR
jgi:hypothetical protein